MIYLRSVLAGILALLLLLSSSYGLFLIVPLWIRLFGKSNTYFVVFHLKSPLVWVFLSAIFVAAFLVELRRASAKAKRQKPA